MTGDQTLRSAREAAEAVRALNHATHSGGASLGVTDVYDVLAELGLLAARLPQALAQLQDIVDDLVETGRVVIVDGEHRGDPVAAVVTAGHWLTVAAGTATGLAHEVDAAQQALAWAAAADT